MAINAAKPATVKPTANPMSLPPERPWEGEECSTLIVGYHCPSGGGDGNLILGIVVGGGDGGGGRDIEVD